MDIFLQGTNGATYTGTLTSGDENLPDIRVLSHTVTSAEETAGEFEIAAPEGKKITHIISFATTITSGSSTVYTFVDGVALVSGDIDYSGTLTENTVYVATVVVEDE